MASLFDNASNFDPFGGAGFGLPSYNTRPNLVGYGSNALTPFGSQQNFSNTGTGAQQYNFGNLGTSATGNQVGFNFPSYNFGGSNNAPFPTTPIPQSQPATNNLTQGSIMPHMPAPTTPPATDYMKQIQDILKGQSTGGYADPKYSYERWQRVSALDAARKAGQLPKGVTYDPTTGDLTIVSPGSAKFKDEYVDVPVGGGAYIRDKRRVRDGNFPDTTQTYKYGTDEYNQAFDKLNVLYDVPRTYYTGGDWGTFKEVPDWVPYNKYDDYIAGKYKLPEPIAPPQEPWDGMIS